MMGIAEAAVRSVALRRDNTTGWLSPTKIWRLLVSVPIAGWMGLFALIAVPLTRRVKWRGVLYDVRSPWTVQLVEYKAFQAVAIGSEASL